MSEPLLPPNATFLETALAYATNPDLPVTIGDIWNPDRCPEKLLPWLAHALSVDVWEPGWPAYIKREVIRSSVMVHRKKGTRGAVERALDALGHGDAEVYESYDVLRYDGSFAYDGSESYAPDDHWAEYRVYLIRPVTILQSDVIREALNAIAPTRCHLKELNFVEFAHVYDGSILYDGTFPYGVA